MGNCARQYAEKDEGVMPIDLDKFSYTLDLTEELRDVPFNKRKKMKSEIGKLLVKEIDSTTKRNRSPVDNARYEKLSKGYREIKIKKGKGGSPNLHLNNKMISSLRNNNARNGVRIESKSKKQIPKLFNHNTGDTLPQRQILPDEELFEDFSPKIMKKVNKIVRKFTVVRKEDRELEERLIKAIGKQGAQTILREGLDIEAILEELEE